jgi:hypothetical protein
MSGRRVRAQRVRRSVRERVRAVSGGWEIRGALRIPACCIINQHTRVCSPAQRSHSIPMYSTRPRPLPSARATTMSRGPFVSEPSRPIRGLFSSKSAPFASRIDRQHTHHADSRQRCGSTSQWKPARGLHTRLVLWPKDSDPGSGALAVSRTRQICGCVAVASLPAS